MDTQTDTELDDFIHGYKKIVALKKTRGVMEVREGKSALSFTGYVALATSMMKLSPSGHKFPWMEGIFSWSFLVLSWNLMSRSINIGSIMLQHIDWNNDCMTIIFGHTKTDQTG
jgi:hypothetical protein